MQDQRFDDAEAALREALALAPDDAALHYALAHALYAQHRDQDALDALDACLARNPDHPPALLYRGILLEQFDRHDDATLSFLRGIRTAERLGIAPSDPEMQRVMAHAAAVVGVALDQRLAEALAPLVDRHGAEAIARIRDGADIFVGKKRPDYPHPLWRPGLFYVPGLSPTLFYGDEVLPTADAMRAAAADIHVEMRTALADGALALYRAGEADGPALARSPRTAQALATLDLADVEGYSPMVEFVVIPAGASIQSRFGPTNGRVIGQLVLQAPDNDARLLVGDEARAYAAGDLIVFDDSFRHSIENDGADDLHLLIFDLWNPQLTPAERQAFAAVLRTAQQFEQRATSPV